MLGWILIGGIALFGFFALKDRADPGAPPGPPVPGSPQAPIPLVPSSAPAVDRELQAAAAALFLSYHAHQGCMGLDQPTVLRFQRALNAYHVALGSAPVVTADGVYDDRTDVILGDMTGTHFPGCALTFQQASAPVPPQAGPQNPETFGGRHGGGAFAAAGFVPPPPPPPGQAPPAPPPGTPETAGPTGVPQQQQSQAQPAPAANDLRFGASVASYSPTAGRRTYHA